MLFLGSFGRCPAPRASLKPTGKETAQEEQRRALALPLALGRVQVLRLEPYVEGHWPFGPPDVERQSEEIHATRPLISALVYGAVFATARLGFMRRSTPQGTRTGSRAAAASPRRQARTRSCCTRARKHPVAPSRAGARMRRAREPENG